MKPIIIKGIWIKEPTKTGRVNWLVSSLLKKSSNSFSTLKKDIVISTKPTKKITQKQFWKKQMMKYLI